MSNRHPTQVGCRCAFFVGKIYIIYLCYSKLFLYLCGPFWKIIQNNMHMFTKNSFSTDRYVTPLCETLEVKFEGVMCQSFSSKGTENMSTDAAEDF